MSSGVGVAFRRQFNEEPRIIPGCLSKCDYLHAVVKGESSQYGGRPSLCAIGINFLEPLVDLHAHVLHFLSGIMF